MKTSADDQPAAATGPAANPPSGGALPALAADVALLVLRVWVGATMLVLHGWSKLANFGERAERFADPFGLGPTASLVLVIAAEVFGSVLLIAGFATRLAACAGMATMAVAFFHAHGARLTGAGNGELPFVFLGAYLALTIAGAGRLSIDAWRKAPRPEPIALHPLNELTRGPH